MAQQTTKNRQRTGRCQARHHQTCSGWLTLLAAADRLRAVRTSAARHGQYATNRAPAAPRGSTGDTSSTCTSAGGNRCSRSRRTRDCQSGSAFRSAVRRSTCRASGLRYAAREDVASREDASSATQKGRRSRVPNRSPGQTPPARTDRAGPGTARDLEHHGRLCLSQSIGQEMEVVEPQEIAAVVMVRHAVPAREQQRMDPAGNPGGGSSTEGDGRRVAQEAPPATAGRRTGPGWLSSSEGRRRIDGRSGPIGRAAAGGSRIRRSASAPLGTRPRRAPRSRAWRRRSTPRGPCPRAA